MSFRNIEVVVDWFGAVMGGVISLSNSPILDNN